MASVTCRRRGKYWEYRFDGASIGGKRKQYSKSGFRTKGEAMKAGVNALTEYNRSGLVFDPATISLADWLDNWLETIIRPKWTAYTYRSYETMVRVHIKPSLGCYRLSAITPQIVAKFLNDIGTILGRKQVNLAKCVLSSAMRSAVVSGLILYNPCSGVRTPVARGTIRESNAITREQFARLLEACPKSLRFVLQLGWYTGMRVSEVLALSWDDVDFDKGTISIVRKLQQSRRPYRFEEPKDGSSRTIAMGKDLKEIMLEEKAKQEADALKYGEYYTVALDSDTLDQRMRKDVPEGTKTRLLVSVQENGRVFTSSIVDEDIWKAGRKLDFHASYHTLRHTHATLLLEAGVSPKAVQHRLGHKSIDTTMRIYTHVTERMKDDLVDKIDHENIFSWSNCGQNAEKSDNEKS